MHPKGTSCGAPTVTFGARVHVPAGLQREISTKFAYFWTDSLAIAFVHDFGEMALFAD